MARSSLPRSSVRVANEGPRLPPPPPLMKAQDNSMKGGSKTRTSVVSLCVSWTISSGHRPPGGSAVFVLGSHVKFHMTASVAPEVCLGCKCQLLSVPRTVCCSGRGGGATHRRTLIFAWIFTEASDTVDARATVSGSNASLMRS